MTSYFQVRKYIHLWVWPDTQMNASGETWDGASYSLKMIKSNSLTFQVDDPLHRTTFVQLALNTTKVNVTFAGSSLLKSSSWSSLVELKDLPSQWFYDFSQKVLWLRLDPKLSSVEIIFS